MKNSQSSPANPDLTVILFRENSIPRTFQFSVNWVYRIGLVAAGLIGIAIFLSLFSGRQFWKLKTLGGVQISQLQEELSKSQSELANANGELASLRARLTTALPGPKAPNLQQPVPEEPQAETPPIEATDHSAILFTDLPAEIRQRTTGVPIEIVEPQLTWRGGVLRVKFALQYTGKDKGNQQGKMIILARGKDRILAYPEGVINRTGQGPLLLPQQGERFSVSRIREAKANFGPVSKAEELTEVEAIILGSDNDLLLYEVFDVPAFKGASKARGAQEAAPQEPTDSSESTDSAGDGT